MGNSARRVLAIKKGSKWEMMAVVLHLELLILALLLVVGPQTRLHAKRRLLSRKTDGKYIMYELVSTRLSCLAVLSCIILFFTYALALLLKTASKIITQITRDIVAVALTIMLAYLQKVK